MPKKRPKFAAEATGFLADGEVLEILIDELTEKIFAKFDVDGFEREVLTFPYRHKVKGSGKLVNVAYINPDAGDRVAMLGVEEEPPCPGT